MDKRYQVFVSSTYTDLKEERQLAIQALMEMDCIPAGMEIFPAVDEEQWEFIKKIIDNSDYYLLIIGGRYGSLAAEGISYTEKEFDYAVEKGLKVVVLIHGDPNKITVEKSDIDHVLREKLENFRSKAQTGRLVKFWNTAKDLPGLVALSMSKTITTYPAKGWVRADKIASVSVLQELNELRKENNILQKTINGLNAQLSDGLENIAEIESNFTIHGHYKSKENLHRVSYSSSWSTSLSWAEIFSSLSPYLKEYPNDDRVKNLLIDYLKKRQKIDGTLVIEDQDFKTITIQLKAYGLIETKWSETIKGTMVLFWYLTKKGEQYMMDTRIVRRKIEKIVTEDARDELLEPPIRSF